MGILVERLSFTYPGATVEALQDVSFEITPGEIFGFLGPSGAGKSTAQRILVKLLSGYAGQVSVMGRDLAAWGADYYERIGVSFELPNHFLKLTARENLRYFAALYERPTLAPQELLSLVGLGDDGDLLVSQYSKGMKNRLSVARALLHGPDLLFLDEPTAGLDPLNSRRIVELVRRQRDAGRTVFLATHDMTVATALCDRVAFLVGGRIALVDTPRALMLRGGERRVRIEVRDGDGTSRHELPLAGLADNSRFLALLRSGKVETIHTLEPTLADVFVEVTGEHLR